MTVMLLGSFAAAAENGERKARTVVPGSIESGQVSPEREAVPEFLFPGHLRLTAEQRQHIWETIQQTNPEQQPVPRAFAPAVGMTAPPQLKLASLPPALENIPSVGKHHEFALLETGVILIVGEDRLISAMIGPDPGKQDSAPGMQRSAPPPSR